jgi:hypothetical protein
MLIVYSITSMLKEIDDYMKRKGISPTSDFKLSNI